MKYEPRRPVSLAERREVERSAVQEIARAVVAKVEGTGRTENVCPECGSADYHHVDGCMLCSSCGYSPCGVH
jgi:ribosomal protein L37AE/L43A